MTKNDCVSAALATASAAEALQERCKKLAAQQPQGNLQLNNRVYAALLSAALALQETFDVRDCDSINRKICHQHMGHIKLAYLYVVPVLCVVLHRNCCSVMQSSRTRLTKPFTTNIASTLQQVNSRIKLPTFNVNI